jgi:hypothetical protein
MPAANLTRPEQLLVASENYATTAAFAGIRGNKIGGMRRPISGRRIGREEPQLGSVAARLLHRDEEPTASIKNGSA